MQCLCDGPGRRCTGDALGGDGSNTTTARCIDLVRRGKGDIEEPSLVEIADQLFLLPGELSLARFEQALAESWGQIHQTDSERAVHVATALRRLAEAAARQKRADVYLIDIGPNLGALNRAALLAADVVLIPVAPDLFSLQGLRNVGPTLMEWRDDWGRAKERIGEPGITHLFEPRGYIVQQHLARADRPVKGYQRWAEQIPGVFRRHVLGKEKISQWPKTIDKDRFCLALLKHFAGLVPLAQLARKPLFDLKQADGIGGGQIQAVARARREFKELVLRILKELELSPA